MTYLICSIMIEDEAAMLEQVHRAWALGADAIELRLDKYQGPLAPIHQLLKDRKEKTWIVTCRSVNEGGQCATLPPERLQRLTQAAQKTDAYIDFELNDWNKLSASLTDQLRNDRIILSSHHFDGCPNDVANSPSRLPSSHKTAIAKIAYTSKHINESFPALDLMHHFGNKVIAIAMKEYGLWTRVLARKLGAFSTYCSLDSSDETAPGQISVDKMISHYRWNSIDSSTKVFGVLGHPVAHSMSPLLFNTWFADAGINALYLPLHVTNTPDALPTFLNECAKRPWLSISGFSVTVPHKQAALAYVGQKADRLAQSIGAVNTLIFDDQQNARGYNTDCHAAIDAIVAALRCEHKDLANLKVDVLGAGGSARAIVAGLRSHACDITIYSRRDEPSQHLAKHFQVMSQPWSQRGQHKSNLLINCTPVGMWPMTNDSPMPPDALKSYGLVFDLIYRPMQTKLLLDAQAQGKSTLNGLDMFIRQAAAQFQLWTGQTPDITKAYQFIENELTKESLPST